VELTAEQAVEQRLHEEIARLRNELDGVRGQHNAAAMALEALEAGTVSGAVFGRLDSLSALFAELRDNASKHREEQRAELDALHGRLDTFGKLLADLVSGSDGARTETDLRNQLAQKHELLVEAQGKLRLAGLPEVRS